MSNPSHMREALDLARENIQAGGRPFGAVLVYQGRVVARAVNEIHSSQDPTAHAEMQAIRQASQVLGTARLDGAEVYASGHPCPMCLAAMHLCGVSRVVYGAANAQGETFGLSTEAIYRQLALPLSEQSIPVQHLPQPAMAETYRRWQARHAPR